MNTLKIEDVKISETEAQRIVAAFTDFAKQIGYNEDRIDNLECRSRPGFSPYSHNKGGIECVAYTSQYIAHMERTGFKNADKTLDLYHQFDVDNFVDEHKFPKKTSKWTQEQHEQFDESRNEDSEATVLFGMDIMYKGKEGTAHVANVRMTVCVKDAPYHRQYDDLLSFDLTWKFHKDLVNQLNKLLKNKKVKLFSANVEEAY